jgi:hypothetical protein
MRISCSTLSQARFNFDKRVIHSTMIAQDFSLSSLLSCFSVDIPPQFAWLSSFKRSGRSLRPPPFRKSNEFPTLELRCEADLPHDAPSEPNLPLADLEKAVKIYDDSKFEETFVSTPLINSDCWKKLQDDPLFSSMKSRDLAFLSISNVTFTNFPGGFLELFTYKGQPFSESVFWRPSKGFTVCGTDSPSINLPIPRIRKKNLLAAYMQNLKVNNVHSQKVLVFVELMHHHVRKKQFLHIGFHLFVENESLIISKLQTLYRVIYNVHFIIQLIKIHVVFAELLLVGIRLFQVN